MSQQNQIADKLMFNFIRGVHIAKNGVATTGSSCSFSDPTMLYSQTIEREVTLLCEENCDFKMLREFTEDLIMKGFHVYYQQYANQQRGLNQNEETVRYGVSVVISLKRTF